MKNLWKHVKLLILCILPIAILLFACLAAYPVLTVRSEKDAKGYSGILRIWQIDNFEGSTGSRSAFINRAARSFEAVNEGTLILVTAHTEQSAASSIAEGNIPDMISFGTGADFVGDIAQPLRGYSFPYAQIGKETYAYPWCRGGYFLFASAEGDFSDVSAQNTVIAQTSLSEVAAYYADISGECTFESTLKAYVNFIGGEYKYMLGTQRDIYRLTARNFSFQAKALGQFSDLWQYISVCTEDALRYEACLRFIAHLLSEEVQKMLPQIGMMSAFYSVYDSSLAVMAEAEQIQPAHSVNAFISAQALDELHSNAQLALKGDKNGAKNLENYLI